MISSRWFIQRVNVSKKRGQISEQDARDDGENDGRRGLKRRARTSLLVVQRAMARC